MAYTADPYDCRAELNTQAKKIVLPDGTAYEYSSLIFCALSTPDIEPGCNVLVMDGTVTRIEGIVKMFSRGQLNCRIWV